MAYNEKLAQRIRELLTTHVGITERKMLGGVSFIILGNMFCGVVRDSLVVRIGPDSYERALAEPHARQMDFTGRPIKSMVFVSPEGYESEDALKKWVQSGMQFALSLPSK
jgi:TfoX/Sxy family transcriptional regulator of competence genes